MKRVLLTFLSLVICAGCKNDLTDKDPVYKEATWNPTISKFSSCGEIDQYLLEHQLTQGDTVSVSASPGFNKADQTYNNQVEGVLEGDILQVSSEYFFFARPEAIEIVRRKDFSLYKTLPVVYASTRRLLVSDDKIVFVGGDYSRTTVQIFDVKSDFKQSYYNSFLGSLLDFRRIENKLHIVTQRYFQSGYDNGDCAQIYRPNQEDGNALITFANQVNLATLPFSTVTTGFMGQADFIHMTADELLLFRNGYTLPSHFRVVKLGESTPTLEQVQTYQGMVKDRWSVLTKDKKIIFAATGVQGRGDASENKLFAYEKMRGLQYELASESQGFGAWEDIKAVRYFMDKAYVVTFQQMDPLFIFDIEDTKNMKLLGSLESPGFSTQLRELSSGILFGLGYADGFRSFKVSLFDVFDPLQPRESQTLIWGESKNSGSYSEALAEPKALFISQEKNRILFPATIMDDYGMNHIMPFSGAVILDFRDRQIKEAGRITHESMRDPNCMYDIRRAFEAQGEIYSFSHFGAMKSSATTFATLAEVPFKTSQAACGKY